MTRHIISENATILDALKMLNTLSGQQMVLLAVDDNRVLKGTLTDGDVRRALLSGATLASKIKDFMHRDFKAITANEIDVNLMRNCRLKGIGILPHLNDDGTIKTIYDLTITHTILPLSAILMAGGRGERLRPLTDSTPKPLLKIGGKAIIDYNIDALLACGISDITVTTGYLAHQIHEHFGKPVKNGVTVKCVQESIPLGTIGAASLIERKTDGNTLVMNSDLLTTISFEEMYLKHIEEHADITIAAIPYIVSVPYAILDTDDAQVKGIEEKPSYSYFANAGIYIFSNELLNTLPNDRRTDATDLIHQAIAQNRKVVYYAINGSWIDVGSHTDFKHAQEIMQHRNRMLS